MSVPGSTVPKPKIAAVERRKACALAHKRALPCASMVEVFKTAPFGAPPPLGALPLGFRSGRGFGGRLFSLPKLALPRTIRGRRSAERRCHNLRRVCGGARLVDKRARLSALHRGDFGPRDRASGDGREAFASPIRQAFARLHPARVQPFKGQSFLVRTDGDPGPPGLMRAKHERRRRLPGSISRTPPEDALGESG